MQLPFTDAEFLDVFAGYNRALWPAAVLLWLLTIGALWRLYRNGSFASPLLSGTLALQWAWAGTAYHWAFFRSINPAAPLFGVLFILQAILLLWFGVVRPRLHFTPSDSRWARPAWAVMIYALLYPFIGLASGLTYPRLPTFGIPCPTALLTAGALLLVPPRDARPVALLPILWAGVGGSAAFLLGIRADLALLFAGGALAIHLLIPPLPRGTHAA